MKGGEGKSRGCSAFSLTYLSFRCNLDFYRFFLGLACGSVQGVCMVPVIAFLTRKG